MSTHGGDQHNEPFNILGHALLENRDEGVYAYCTFNETESGKTAKQLVRHKDIASLSIYANQLKQQGGNVQHGVIREVSLVLASANPGAFIDSVLRHGEEMDDEAIIYTGEDISLYHGETPKDERDGRKPAEEQPEGKPEKKEEENTVDKPEKKPEKEKTVGEVFDELTEEQKTVVYAMIGQALEDAGGSDDEDDADDDESEKGGKNKMKHNVFDSDERQEDILSHSDMTAIFADAKRCGSLKESVLAHGIENIDLLFQDAQAVSGTPEFIKRDTGWVGKVMAGSHHTPFARIKSVFADITEDDARANGYIKGKLKKDEVFGLLKRVTNPTTIYKKQKIDRDDVTDITDETSYSFTDMVSNIGKFTAQRVPLEQAITAMEGIANAAALAGQGSGEASRAMYNFAQALGVGAVKLMDWKSIENANMATAEFKQTIIDSAVSLGTLQKKADGTFRTIKGNAVTIENFSSTLSEAWFSKDVLMNALEKYGAYADEVYSIATEKGISCAEAMKLVAAETGSLGERAFKAAQEAKTFTDAIEATKDAVSTGWMKTFEIIFGDLVAGALWDIFASGAEAFLASSGQFR